jgi:hypothetical protein
MFEELPELETKEFIEKEFISIRWSEKDIRGFPEKIIWLSKNLWQYFKKEYPNVRDFQKRLVYEIGCHDINLIWNTLMYAEDEYKNELKDHFHQFRHIIWNEIPETENANQITFIWLYLDWLQAEFLKTKNIN